MQRGAVFYVLILTPNGLYYNFKNMKITKLLFVAALFLLLLTACSPRVTTEIIKTYPPLIADSVWVYEPGEVIPNSAEPIGRVSVTDAGATTKCKYDQVLWIAREETAKVGGNGFVVTEHKTPAIWGSSCHQISGTMLYINDWTIDTEASNSITDAIEAEHIALEEKMKKRQVPANTVGLDVGIGYVYSKIYTPYRTYRGKSGVDWKLEYNRVYRNGLGFGLQYSGFRTNFLGGGYMLLAYIAPSFIGRVKLSDVWILKYGIGIGYFGYSDSGDILSGVGLDVNIGAEYMVSKHVGLGIEVQSLSSYLSGQEGVTLGEDEHSGISRINIKGGVRFYF